MDPIFVTSVSLFTLDYLSEHSYSHIGLGWPFPQSHKLSLTYWLKSSPLLAFCFLSLNGLSNSNLFLMRGWKNESWIHELLGDLTWMRDLIWKEDPQTPLLIMSIEYFEGHSFTVSTIRVIASLLFLILPWFSWYFLYVLNVTLSSLEPLYRCSTVSSKEHSTPLPLKVIRFFCVVPQKIQKSYLLPNLQQKITIKSITYETTKVNIKNLLRDWQTTAGFINQWCHKLSLVNKKE